MEHHYKAISRALEDFRYKRNPLKAYCDCIHALALTYATMTDPYKNKERLDELKSTYEIYKDSETEFTNLKNAISDLLKDMHNNYGDYLGKIYMELVPQSANSHGQVFTPYHIAKLMSQMVLNKDDFKGKERIKVYDPCCGAGVFSIATCDMLNDEKINYTMQAVFVAEDIDKTCVEMAYLQLSFLGASAVIQHKNTITQEKWDEYKTLGFLLTRWAV